MSRYIVQTIGPAGYERYLSRGREVQSSDNATHYSSPSAAETAIAAHRAKHANELFTARVLDTRDPERVVLS